jgi:hypothetical protein
MLHELRPSVVDFQVTKRSIEYLHMDPVDLRDVIREDGLNIRCEEHLFEAIVRWIDFDNTSRSSYIADLLRNVRLGLIPLAYFIETVSTNPYVTTGGSRCDALVQVSVEAPQASENNVSYAVHFLPSAGARR